MKSTSMLVVGSINMDLVLPVPRLPQAGESLFGKTYTYVPGGKGANQAVAAARLGAQVSFCGRVGNDDNGRTLVQNLANDGIDTSGIVFDDTTPTGLAVIPVEPNGQNRIIIVPGANLCVTRADLQKAFEREFSVVVAQLEVPLDIVFEAYALARARQIPFVLDAGPAMSIDLSPLTGIEVLSPNETEIFALTGIAADTDEGAVEAAAALARRYETKAVVLKLGGRGALLYQNGCAELIPTFQRIKPVDTTAAGDSFTAALAMRMAQGWTLPDAIRYAHAVGSICVTRKGAQPSLPTAAEVEAFLKDPSVF